MSKKKRKNFCEQNCMSTGPRIAECRALLQCGVSSAACPTQRGVYSPAGAGQPQIRRTTTQPSTAPKLPRTIPDGSGVEATFGSVAIDAVVMPAVLMSGWIGGKGGEGGRFCTRTDA